MISEKEIFERHGKIKDALPDVDYSQSLQIQLYEDVIYSIINQNGITVRQLKGLLRLTLNGKPKQAAAPKALKSFCKCGAPALRKHTCPVETEIYNNYEKKCNCCDACQKECSRDC